MKLGLVIDLDTCVGCHACATACKQWNASGVTGPLTDEKPYGRDPSGVWFNRVRTFEAEDSPESPGRAGGAFSNVVHALRRRRLRFGLPHRRII